MKEVPVTQMGVIIPMNVGLPSFLPAYGFAAVALIIFAGEIGIPVLIPGELMLFLAGNEFLNSTFAVLTACLAIALVDFVASLALHLTARTGGNVLLRWVLKRISTGKKQRRDVLTRWRRRIGNHDAMIVFIVRVIPGIRISGSLLSGLLRLPLRRFIVGAVPASLVWTSVPLVLGYEIRTHVGAIGSPDTQLLLLTGIGMCVALLVAGSAWWVIHARHHGGGRRPRSGWTSAS